MAEPHGTALIVGAGNGLSAALAPKLSAGLPFRARRFKNLSEVTG